MCHTNFQQSLPSDGSSEYWDNSRDAHYYSEAPTVNLEDSLQYTTDELCIVGNNQSNALGAQCYPSCSPSGHHFAIAENISREYYGS